MIYAGIGSRETPEGVLLKMEKIAFYLAHRYDATLRSGGAIGADIAFEAGCDSANGKKEIFYAKGGRTKSSRLKKHGKKQDALLQRYIQLGTGVMNM